MKEKGLLERMEDNKVVKYVLHPPIPKKSFLIEVTNACNSQCIFCANQKMTRKRGSIKKELLEKILKDAYNEGIREVGFYATGEPLIYKDIEKAIAMAKEIGFDYVYITTNGVLATVEKVQALVESGLDSLKFSINAIDKETYHFIHGKDDFETVIRNLKEINEYRKTLEKKLKLYVSYIATKYSAKSNKEVSEYFKDLCDEVVVLNVINQSGLMPEVEGLLKVQGIDMDMELGITLPCSIVFDSITISYEGYMTACCADFQNYLAYADLNEVTIAEAWNNDVIVKLREMHLNGDAGCTLCGNCVCNSISMPVPLVKEFATDFEEKAMFNSNLVENRINEFCECKGK